jgi:hypothetical protein
MFRRHQRRPLADLGPELDMTLDDAIQILSNHRASKSKQRAADVTEVKSRGDLTAQEGDADG